MLEAPVFLFQMMYMMIAMFIPVVVILFLVRKFSNSLGKTLGSIFAIFK